MKEHPDTTPEQKLNEGEQPIPDDEAAIAAVESARDRDADAYTDAIKRGDFFRDQLAEHVECPPRSLGLPCAGVYGCLHDRDGYPDYAACWDEVERRQR